MTNQIALISKDKTNSLFYNSFNLNSENRFGIKITPLVVLVSFAGFRDKLRDNYA